MYTTENAELKAAYEESLEHLETMKKKKKALKVKYSFDVRKFCTSWAPWFLLNDLLGFLPAPISLSLFLAVLSVSEDINLVL